MYTKLERFFTFIRNEKILKIVAFALYCMFIITMLVDSPVVQFNCVVLLLIICTFWYMIYLPDLINKSFELNKEKIKEKLKEKIIKIIKEIVIFIPFYLISNYIISLFIVGESVNQTSVVQSLKESTILQSIIVVIIGPIIEEFIFRFLPYKFIKNTTVYIIVSTVIFAAMHVIDDPNPFYYIWAYIMRSLYYGYTYHKTKDICVPIALHSFKNLIAVSLILL